MSLLVLIVDKTGGLIAENRTWCASVLGVSVSDVCFVLWCLVMLCVCVCVCCVFLCFFFFQAEDGIRDLVRSRGLGDVYKRQVLYCISPPWEKWVFGFLRVHVFRWFAVRQATVVVLSLIHI